MKRRLLLVDDDTLGVEQLRKLLERDDLSVDVVSNGQGALTALGEKDYSVVITDLKMPGMGGMEFIRELSKRRLPVTVIVTTAYGSIDRAVEAIRLGAFDFLTKPIEPNALKIVMECAFKGRALQDEVLLLRKNCANDTISTTS